MSGPNLLREGKGADIMQFFSPHIMAVRIRFCNCKIPNIAIIITITVIFPINITVSVRDIQSWKALERLEIWIWFHIDSCQSTSDIISWSGNDPATLRVGKQTRNRGIKVRFSNPEARWQYPLGSDVAQSTIKLLSLHICVGKVDIGEIASQKYKISNLRSLNVYDVIVSAQKSRASVIGRNSMVFFCVVYFRVWSAGYGRCEWEWQAAGYGRCER